MYKEKIIDYLKGINRYEEFLCITEINEMRDFCKRSVWIKEYKNLR